MKKNKKCGQQVNSAACTDTIGPGVVKAIIFDLGNVLIDFDHRIAAQRISRYTDKKPEEICALFFASPITALFEEGRISAQKFFREVKEMLNLKLSYNRFLPIWNEIFYLSQKNKQIYDLAKRLKKSYKLALLSNINILHFRYLKHSFSVFDAFHYIITSFELKVCKPHPLIYQKTLDILKVHPKSVFYTDDRAELVENANRLGLRGFVFKNVEQLYEDLKSTGVNIN